MLNTERIRSDGVVAALIVSAALAHPAHAQHRWKTIEDPGTPSGMLQYDVASVMRAQTDNIVSVLERLNYPGEGIGKWKLATGKRFTYAYRVTHWTFNCATHTSDRGAVGYFDASGHLIDADPDMSLDGLDPGFWPVEPGSWTAATMHAVCG